MRNADTQRPREEMMKSQNKILKRIVFFALIIVAMAIVFFVCLGVGEVHVGPGALWQILSGGGDARVRDIILQIRLPRVLLAMAVGAGLAVSGTVLQGVLQNPLADPYTLGVSGGAALGVAVGTVFFPGEAGVAVFAFAGALLSILFVYLIAARGVFTVTILVLGGIVMSYIFSSSILLLFSLAQPSKFQSVLLWLMGDLSAAGPGQAMRVGVVVVAGAAMFMAFHREMDVLTLGTERSGHLGLDPARTVRLLFVLASIVTASCVAASGIVGFVGLIVPHFVRRVGGVSHAFVIPASCVAGALFLTLADTLARTVIYPLELPVGVITGILGGLLFLVFLLRTRRWEFFR
jgi:iron complex transport system permease protein